MPVNVVIHEGRLTCEVRAKLRGLQKMEPARFIRLCRLEPWLEKRHRRACEAGDFARPFRYANLMTLAAVKTEAYFTSNVARGA
jgi:hypothetical protein